MSLHITGDDAADRLLTDDPLAMLIGMLLDQQVAMETAFAGPLKIAERAGTLEADAIATFDPDAFAELFKATPAVHRFPGSMAARVQALCAAVAQDWGGDAAAIWTQDEAAAIRIGDAVETGTWFMNRCDYLDPELAWTGVKDSGRGCTLSKLGFDYLTRPKSFHLKSI